MRTPHSGGGHFAGAFSKSLSRIDPPALMREDASGSVSGKSPQGVPGTEPAIQQGPVAGDYLVSQAESGVLRGPHSAPSQPPVPRISRRWQTILFALLLVGVITYADYASGVQIGLAPFYFLPIGMVAWRVGVKAGVAFAFLSTVGWELSNQVHGMAHAGAWIDALNITTHFAAYASASWLISGQRRETERERSLSRMDALTGVANARAFYESATAEISRAGRFGRPFSFVFLDVDDFKSVNDEMGHTAGDRLLVLLAHTMRRSTRASDVVARLGGDEFGILFPEQDPAAMQAAVKKIQSEIRLATLRFGRPVTVSMGALCCTTPPASVDEMLHRADVLMYQKKAAGKNGARFEIVIQAESD